MRHAGLQRVVAHEAHLAHFAFAGRLNERPVAHDRFALDLAIDRPGRTVIMRLALPRIAISMRADAEAKLRILIENVALADTGAEIARDEFLIFAGFLDESAHLPAPLNAGISGERTVAFGGEFFQGQADLRLLGISCADKGSNGRGRARYRNGCRAP